MDGDGPTQEAVDDQLEDLVEHLKSFLPLTVVEASVREVYKPTKIEGYRPSRYTSQVWALESGPGEYYHGVSFRINADDPSGAAADSICSGTFGSNTRSSTFLETSRNRREIVIFAGFACRNRLSEALELIFAGRSRSGRLEKP